MKVDGLKTEFHRSPYPKVAMKIISRKEFSRFSHQVPSYLLTDLESKNAPKGCLELDLAACSSEFNQVILKPRNKSLVNSEKEPVG